jgi:tetratricopeptide (TPR) repeat protein
MRAAGACTARIILYLGHFVDARSGLQVAQRRCQEATMWNDPGTEVHAMLGRGELEAALRFANASVAATEESFGASHDNAALARIARGQAELANGHLDAAKQDFHRALHLLRGEGALARVRAADALEGLGIVFGAKGDHANAERSFVDAVEIRERDLGPDHPSIALSLEKLSALYVEGEFDDDRALPLLLRAMRILTATTEHRRDLARIELKIAHVLTDRGDDEAAAPHLERALGIVRTLDGTHSPKLAETLHDLAMTCARRGANVRAESLLEQALVLLVGEDPKIATAIRYSADLADAYRQTGEQGRALEHYLAALAMRQKLDGSADPLSAPGFADGEDSSQGAAARRAPSLADLEARIEELSRPSSQRSRDASPVTRR